MEKGQKSDGRVHLKTTLRVTFGVKTRKQNLHTHFILLSAPLHKEIRRPKQIVVALSVCFEDRN